MQSGQSMRGSSAQAIYSQRIELLADGRFVSEPSVCPSNGSDLISFWFINKISYQLERVALHFDWDFLKKYPTIAWENLAFF